MEKKLLETLEQKLTKEKEEIEKQLESFATKDKNLKDDWDTKFPKFNGEDSSSGNMEQAADEVEEYGTLLPIEHGLELKLKNINLALEKIKGNKYGICEKCQNKIEENRLKIFPEARYCLKCKQKNGRND